MSWSAQVSSIKTEDVGQALQDVVNAQPNVQGNYAETEARAMIKESITAVETIVADWPGRVTVTISGHANPEFKLAQGWTSNEVRITIHQASDGD